MDLRSARFITKTYQTKLSQRTGINQATISLIENRKVTPSKWQKDAIEKVLNIPIDWDEKKSKFRRIK